MNKRSWRRWIQQYKYSAMMTSALLLEEVVISKYDVINISRQLDGSAMMTSAVMSSQSAVDKRSTRCADNSRFYKRVLVRSVKNIEEQKRENRLVWQTLEKSEVYDEQEKPEKMDSAVQVFSDDDVSIAIGRSCDQQDIAIKEEQVLTWAETDSVQKALQRRLYIVAKYTEMILRKFLEVHRKNFRSDQPTSSVDLQMIDLLSDAHLFALETLHTQMRAHGLKWPVGTINICTAIVIVGPVVDRTDSVTAAPVVDTVTDSTVALDTFQRSPDPDSFSPSSYSPMRFTTDDIPPGYEPTVVLPPDLTSEFAQLCASVDQISLSVFKPKFKLRG
ncbi:hypothetical protein F511_19997 [Dorcoceras hygrometricum]|uniref:Uncharacterized protein n=1 Tax=Dorcoceras hygrometricum TaxID=472368 RepID=A0A2Z7AF92_9LAMI|nr:hypothetical protein F511_19997 [Dorcoceras hygrometricum]